MKLSHFLPLLLFGFSSFLIGQTVLPSSGPIHVEGQIIGAENQKITLINKYLGGEKSPIAIVLADSAGNFSIDTTIAVRDYYFLRLENKQMINLILEPNDRIRVVGKADNLLNTVQFGNSDNSAKLNGFLKSFKQFKGIEDSLKKVIKINPQKQAEVNAFFTPLAQSFYAYRNDFVNKNQTSPALLGTLGSFNPDKEWESYKQVATMLTASFGDSPSIQNLNRYLVQKEAQILQAQKENAARAALFVPGTKAIDIVMPNAEGKTIKLSDLKGKVVLIDFWASWCRPCRQENPNVVRAYNKYNKDGFDVFSVSLDKKGAKERWLGAIKQDGLIWENHVSTLEGFSTKAAQDYMVRGIPFTVLIDAEGKVIATNLRGPALEKELNRIFGH